MIHSTLARQLGKHGLDAATAPSGDAWCAFLDRVSRTYQQADEDRYTVDRSIDRMSEEMSHLNLALHQRLGETETLLAISQAVGSNLDTLEAMRRVAQEMACALGADMVGGYLSRSGFAHLEPVAGYHVPPHLLESFLPMPLAGHPALEQMWAGQRPVHSSDAPNDPRFHPTAFQRWPHRSVLFTPIVAEDESIGALIAVWWECERRFTDAELKLAVGIGRQAGLAIRHRFASDELRRAHAETEQLLASIAWILIAVDGDERVTQWNGAAETTFGLARADAMGQRLAELDIPWTWDGVRVRLASARESALPAGFEEVRYRRQDGSEGFLTLTVSRLTRADGQRQGFVLLGSEITERRVLETQLAQSQKLEAIGQLAAGIAHELNTPIQFVGDNMRFLDGALADVQDLLGAYQALHHAAETGVVPPAVLDEVRRCEEASDVGYLRGEIPQAIAQSLDGVTRVASIVRALKGFAHPDQKEKVGFDINQALLDTLTVARNEIKYVAEVETELGDLPLVVCLPGELNQAFLNLIVNAAHAIGDVVKGTGQKGCIQVRTWRDGDGAVISIGDSGGGIPESIRSRIFDPFFTTKPVGRGTGQGLAIARSVIVGKHGGTLTFDTEVGRGTTFFIRLPVAGTPAAASAVAEPPATNAPAPRRPAREARADAGRPGDPVPAYNL